MRKIMKRIMNLTPIKIWMIYHSHVIKGLKQYGRIKEFGGWDKPVISCTPRGTGDFYLMGMYFSEWLKKNKVHEYTLITCGKAEERTLMLFPHIVNKGKIQVIDWEEYCDLTHFALFYGANDIDIIVFNHIAHFSGQYTNWLWNTWNLMGYKNLDLRKMYLYHGLCLDANSVKNMPVFSSDEKAIRNLFQKYNLKIGKTVLLSPFSTGNSQLPEVFQWSRIVDLLTEAGYSVCTNCFGEEQPIKDTVKVEISYKEIVPFLDKAGYCIGIRSGLMDIISTSKCKKFIIHTYYANHWPNGNSISYTGLNIMGLSEDAYEYELLPNNGNVLEIQFKILKEFGIVYSRKKFKEQKVVKIKYVDVPPDFDQERHWITRVLRKKYIVVFSDAPDFLFYSVFGMSYKGYGNCVKIFFTGEDEIPNFNECDYAMCHDLIDFGDRYLRADVGERYGDNIGDINPDWIKVGFTKKGWINSSLIDIKPSIQDRSAVSEKLCKRRFCNFVYSNEVFGQGAFLRKEFCQELMKYRRVDCPGRVLHNMSNKELPLRWIKKDGRDSINENWVTDKLEFISKYKFTIAFENTAMAGHTTEKLIHPLYAYSIPIYWGNPAVTHDFNPKAFVNCNDYDNDFKAVIQKVKELDRNQDKYLEMLAQPPMQPDFDYGTEQKAIEFIYKIIERGNKPYPKCELTYTAPNIFRNNERNMEERIAELDRIQNSNSWRVMRRIQNFAESPAGVLPRKAFVFLLDLYRKIRYRL